VPSILTKDLKSNLEETRSRLLSERKAILQAAKSEAEAELDKTLQHIDQLLGSSSSAPSKPAAKAKVSPAAEAAPAPKASPAPKGKGKAKAAAPAETKKAAPAAKGRKSSKSFDASSLKSEFKSMKAMDAIVQVLGGAKESMSIDDLIGRLYDPFDEAEMSKARMSVAITTKHAERRGLLKKVQDNPSRFSAS
jgi:pyruvate/2-oxoglutarate dehydrogenase complex dihydrolipoamide acyltransferase (E2) component